MTTIRHSILGLSFIFLSIASFAQFTGPARYSEARFAEISIDKNIVYAQAQALAFPWMNQNNTILQNLNIDIYRPANDSINKRPCLIFAHSGGFLTGSRGHDDMVALCDSFAHLGYICVDLEYRLGMSNDSMSSTRAVYRGLQDSRAAIRYLKEFHTDYGVDTTNIYISGSSAGSFVALQNLYLNKEEERPLATYAGGSAPNTHPDLGCLDCSGNSYAQNGRAKAAIGLWGALSDTLIVEAEDGNAVLLVHGTDDDVVMFDKGPPWGYSFLPVAWGSKTIAQRLESLGFSPKTYFVEGKGHEFYNTSNGMWSPAPNAYWDTIYYKALNFFYEQHRPIASFSYSSDYTNIQFTDAQPDYPDVLWDFGDGETYSGHNPLHTYDTAGLYLVQMFVQNQIGSRDSTSQWIEVFDKIYLTSLEVYSVNGVYEIIENQGTLQFSYRAEPETASDTTIIWSLRNIDGLAQINAFGRLQALQNGSIYVIATARDGSFVRDSVMVQISGQHILVDDIDVLSSTGSYSIDIPAGQLQMEAIVHPDNATNQNIAWSITSADGMAEISENGLVTALENGLVYTVATAKDASGTKDSVAVLISGQHTSIGEKDAAFWPEYRLQADKVLFFASERTSYTTRILSLNGIECRTKSAEGNATIEIDGLAKGIYLLQISAQGISKTQKLLISK